MYNQKTLNIEHIDNEIQKLRKKIKALQKFKEKIAEALSHEPDTLEGMVAKKYVETCKMNVVAEYLNGLGYRIETDRGSRKYASGDIRDMILKVQEKGQLFDTAKTILKYNSKSMNLKDIMKLYEEKETE